MRHPFFQPRCTVTSEQLERRLLFLIGMDPAFGVGGIATVDSGVSGVGSTVLIRELADGNIITVAEVGLSEGAGGTGVSAAIARFSANGLPDTTFGGGDGLVLVPIGGKVADAVLQPDGKLVIVGQRGNGDLAVERVSTSGILDMTFAGDGVAEMVVESNARESFNATGAAFSPNGTIVASGSLRIGDDDGHIVIARFTSGGSADTNFRGVGRATTASAAAMAPTRSGVRSDMTRSAPASAMITSMAAPARTSSSDSKATTSSTPVATTMRLTAAPDATCSRPATAMTSSSTRTG